MHVTVNITVPAPTPVTLDLDRRPAGPPGPVGPPGPPGTPDLSAINASISNLTTYVNNVYQETQTAAYNAQYAQAYAERVSIDSRLWDWWLQNGLKMEASNQDLTTGGCPLIFDGSSVVDFAVMGVLPYSCTGFVVTGYSPPNQFPRVHVFHHSVRDVRIQNAMTLPPIATFLQDLAQEMPVTGGSMVFASGTILTDTEAEWGTAKATLEGYGWTFTGWPVASPPLSEWLLVPNDGTLSEGSTIAGNYKAARGYVNGGSPILSGDGPDILLFMNPPVYDQFVYSPGPYSSEYTWPTTNGGYSTFYAGSCYVSHML